MSYDDWHAEVYTSLMFAVLPSMGAQLSLSGSSPTVGLESHSGDSYGLSGSIYKTFFDGRLYVSLGFGGLFYRKWQIQETVKTDGSYYAVIRRRNHNRQWISLSASFRFRHNVRKPFRTVEMLQEMQEELCYAEAAAETIGCSDFFIGADRDLPGLRRTVWCRGGGTVSFRSAVRVGAAPSFGHPAAE